MEKYKLGAGGGYHVHLHQNPGYDGERKETFPQYNTLMWDSLEKGLHHAQECQHLHEKRHHDPELYKATVKVCTWYADLFKALMPLEQQRKNILEQLQK